MDNQNDSADRRWAAAAELTAGISDDGLSRRRARTLGWVAAVIVGAAVLGFVLALVLIPRGHDADLVGGPSEQQLIGQLLFLALGLIVGVGGFVWARRNGYYITRWRHGSSPLNRQEKKAVRRQIAAKERPDDHILVVVAIARQNRRATLGVAPTYAAIMFFAISSAISTNLLAIKLLELAAVTLLLVVAVQLSIGYKRAGAFIKRYGAHTLDSSP